jgi:transposase InsO family protein
MPADNGLIEPFNGRLRDEFLNVHEFVTLHDAREKLRLGKTTIITTVPMAHSAT